MSDEDVPSVETAAEDGDESETIVDFLKEFLESKTWTTLLMTATFWALFQTDVCTMYFSKEVDPAVAYISLGWFIVFMFEMFLNFALGLDYGANKGLGKFTFYMMLDLVGTLSLIPDFIILFGVELPATGSAKMARAARTARIGARLTRLMKLFRSKGGNSAYSQMMLGDESDAMQESAASKFGEDVSDGISKKVVILTLVLLISVPFFMPLIKEAKVDAIRMIETMPNDKLLQAFAVNDGPITFFQNFEDAQLAQLQLLDDPTWTSSTTNGNHNCASYAPVDECGMLESGSTVVSQVADWCPNQASGASAASQYANCELHGADIKCPESCRVITQNLVDWVDTNRMRESELAVFSPEEGTKEGGEERKATTLKATFYKRNIAVADANMTVLYMLFNILVFGASTGVFLNEIFDLVVNPIERICSALQNLAKSMKSLQAEAGDDEDEFQMLGKSILKLTDLLKTSLGEAGTAIIANNIDADDDSINAMVPGTRMSGYFGFCDVRGFDKVLADLEEDTMVFTNTISAIVHKKVAEHMGAPNKNMGDSWLSVWNGREESTYQTEGGMTFADHALTAFVEIKDAVKASAALSGMKTDSPDMGFGLHYGWAIEGAVGSERKVDATYLSPHVNMAARLEKATRQYDCSILVTEEMYNRMSPGVQKNLRAVDRVLVVGSSWPMKIYAYDEGPDEGNAVLAKKNRFATEFDQAVDCYIGGEWKEAKKLLFSCLGSRNNDVAATNLIDFMAANGRGDSPPESWQGYRMLDSK
jgi:class 3 adenylate cyclase